MLFYERVDGSAAPLHSLTQVGETCADVTGMSVMNELAARIPLPDDSDDEFTSSDEERPALPPRRSQPQQLPTPAPSPSKPESENPSQGASEESDTTSTDSTTEGDNEDLFQSSAAATGFTVPPTGEAIRMRTSSAFATSNGAEDPLQSPIRMGTAF
jgi:hypothetical protein